MCSPPPAASSTVEAAFVCGEYGAPLASSRALSTDERHRHPGIRNGKRLAEMSRENKTHGNTKWTEEEVQSLVELNEKFGAHKFIKREIAPVMGTKTMKQISDKRRRLGLCPWVAGVHVGVEEVNRSAVVDSDHGCSPDLESPRSAVVASGLSAAPVGRSGAPSPPRTRAEDIPIAAVEELDSWRRADRDRAISVPVGNNDLQGLDTGWMGS
jgi:hypothetical protein